MLIVIAGIFLCSALGSDAHGAPGLVLPEVSAGTLPYRTFSGDLCEAPTELLTVPDGQDFLVTMVATSTDSTITGYGDWSAHLGSMLLQDGGNVELVDIDDGVVKVRLVGACVSCSSSLMTLKMGIEKALKKAIPMVRCVEAVE